MLSCTAASISCTMSAGGGASTGVLGVYSSFAWIASVCLRQQCARKSVSILLSALPQRGIGTRTMNTLTIASAGGSC